MVKSRIIHHFHTYRLMLLEEEHADPEALAEILLETCQSITYSLGEQVTRT